MALTAETASLLLTRVESNDQLMAVDPALKVEVLNLAAANGRTITGWGISGARALVVVRVNASGLEETWIVQRK